ncbi:hypothetical protein TIFTF001_007108 [Ficus carica]|uniref:DDE Tnp4 domain-containing protein n=1 Tax=Ficus carica TaxID=3494 RepID=A0AA87ZKH2_FICCA|nr:hypothetical protein TIFTF001_007108 [Ficus carica]
MQLGKKNMNDRGSAHYREANNHGSENGQRNVSAMAAMSVFAYRTWRRSMCRDPIPMHNSSLTGQMRVHEILNDHPRIIQGVTIQQASYLFQHSKETTSRWFYAMLLTICSLKDEFIRPPDYTAVQPLIQEHGYKYRPWFDNILAACSFDMKFTYILTGNEGSCHDARMLGETIAFKGFPIPPPDYKVDDVASGTGPSTGPQHHDTRRDAMNMLRDMMADDMWDRFQSAPWYRTT